MQEKTKNALILIALAIIPTFLVWTPFLLRLETFLNIPLPKEGLLTIVANYDGPLYIAIAKTFYNLDQIKQNFSFNLPVEYYAAHFPFFPLLIRLFSLLITTYPYAMLATTISSSILCLFFFYKFINLYVNPKQALFLSTIFSIFPARFLVVRSVGSPEPLFVACIIASVYYFQNEKYLKAGLWGALAQLTKSPGILLFVAYAGLIITTEFNRLATTSSEKWLKTLSLRVLPVLLIPLALVVVFGLYHFTFGNFFAYFNSGDNIHLFFPPFQIFNYSQPWVNTHWLEEVIFVYLLGTVGLIQLIKQKHSLLAWFVGVFFTSLVFISHRDLMRYALPIIPFLFVAFSDYLVKKEFKYIFLFLLIPIYLFSLAFISNNIMPIANWSPLL